MAPRSPFPTTTANAWHGTGECPRARARATDFEPHNNPRAHPPTYPSYAGLDGYSISEVAKAVEADYGKIDILVHSLANGPEVVKPLLGQ